MNVLTTVLVTSLFVLSGAVTTFTVPYRNGAVIKGNNSWYVSLHDRVPVLNLDGSTSCLVAEAVTSDFETFNATAGADCYSPQVFFKGKLITCSIGCSWSTDGLKWNSYPNTSVLGRRAPIYFGMAASERGIMLLIAETGFELKWITDDMATSWEDITPHPKLNVSNLPDVWTTFDLVTAVQITYPDPISGGIVFDVFWFDDTTKTWHYQRRTQIDYSNGRTLLTPEILSALYSKCGDNCYLSVEQDHYPNGMKVSHDLDTWVSVPFPSEAYILGVCCRGTTCLASTKDELGDHVFQFDVNNASYPKLVMETGSPSIFVTCESDKALMLTIGGRVLIELPSLQVVRNESDAFLGTQITGLASATDKEGNTKAVVIGQTVTLTPPYSTEVAYQRDEFSEWKRVDLSTLRIWESFVNCDILPDYIRQGRLGACYYHFENGTILRFKHLPRSYHYLLIFPISAQLRFLTVVDGIFHFIGNSTANNTDFFILPTRLELSSENVLILERSIENFSATYACSNGSVAIVGGARPTMPIPGFYPHPYYYINGTSWKQNIGLDTQNGDRCVVKDSVFIIFGYVDSHYYIISDVEDNNRREVESGIVRVAIFPELDSIGLVGQTSDGGFHHVYYNSTSYSLGAHRNRMVTPNCGAERLQFVLGENDAVLGRCGEAVFQV